MHLEGAVNHPKAKSRNAATRESRACYGGDTARRGVLCLKTKTRASVSPADSSDARATFHTDFFGFCTPFKVVSSAIRSIRSALKTAVKGATLSIALKGKTSYLFYFFGERS